MSPRAAWRLESLDFTQVYDYVAGKVDWGAAGLPVEGTLSSEPTVGTAVLLDTPTCAPTDRLQVVQANIKASGWETCVVVNEENVVLGLLGQKALGSESDAAVDDAMTSGPSTVRPNASLARTRERLQAKGVTQVVVTTSDGRLVGVARLVLSGHLSNPPGDPERAAREGDATSVATCRLPS